MTAKIAPSQTAESLCAELKELGLRLVQENKSDHARLVFKKIIELDAKDIVSRVIYAQLIDDGTHKRFAESRDLLLSILDEHPDIFHTSIDGNLHLIRTAAQRCSLVGPDNKAIELYRRLAPASNKAGDYFALSEVLTKGNFLEEAISNLEKAITLDPETYDTDANRETVRIARSNTGPTPDKRNNKKKIGRYPLTADFLGDFQKLIRDHIAVNLTAEPKFLSKDTRFFTMGSCFARNLSRSLNNSGYTSHHMEISEYINTTFANKVFVDWLGGAPIDRAISGRIVELLPPDWSKEHTLAVIRSSDVFILTLGVAPAFFDRATGDFVLPRPTALNSRVLAEKCLYRTTSVKENVDNVLHVIKFIRGIVPRIKIIVTVSPVPLLASFEYESAVQADCLSKSTMRLVAHEVVNNSNITDILYWPSFEIFRWAGSQASDYFAADDGAAWHVSEEKVAGTIKAFVEMFSTAMEKPELSEGNKAE
jgi:tetratricopeptide (TPR) repeat protein